MKKYSTFRMFLEYISIMFSIYLIGSLIVSLIGGYSYREILTSDNQPWATFWLYWWPPMFRMIDMEEHNNSIDNSKNTKNE